MTGGGAVVRAKRIVDAQNEFEARLKVEPLILAPAIEELRKAIYDEAVPVACYALAQAAEIERLTRELDQCVACLNDRVAEKQASEARTADLLKALRECHTQLFHLFSMVEGEVPSLLEDHHSYPKIREALELGDAAIAAAKGGTV